MRARKLNEGPCLDPKEFVKMNKTLQWQPMHIDPDDAKRSLREYDAGGIALPRGVKRGLVGYANAERDVAELVLDLRLDGGSVPVAIPDDDGELMMCIGFSRAELQDFPVAQGGRVLIEYSDTRLEQWASELVERLKRDKPERYREVLAMRDGDERRLRDDMMAEHRAYGLADVVRVTDGMSELINSRNGKYYGREIPEHGIFKAKPPSLTPPSSSAAEVLRTVLESLLGSEHANDAKEHVCDERCEDAGNALAELFEQLQKLEPIGIFGAKSMKLRHIDKHGRELDHGRWDAYRRDETYRSCHRETMRSAKHPDVYAELVCDWVGIVAELPELEAELRALCSGFLVGMLLRMQEKGLADT